MKKIKAEKSKQNKALIKNALIPGVDVVVVGSLNPIAIATWFVVKNIYGLYADLCRDEIEDFFNKVNERLDRIDKEISNDRKFQQGLLIQVEHLIRTRKAEKREILKEIFIEGFVSSNDKDNFELEKLNNTVGLISMKNIEFLTYHYKNDHSKKVGINTIKDSLGRYTYSNEDLENLKALSSLGILLERVELKDRNRQVVGFIVEADIEYELSDFGKDFIRYINS